MLICDKCGTLYYYGPDNKKEIKKADCGCSKYSYSTEYYQRKKREFDIELKKSKFQRKCRCCKEYFVVEHSLQLYCTKCKNKRNKK